MAMVSLLDRLGRRVLKGSGFWLVETEVGSDGARSRS